jgi:aminoglycoside phosphotransferase (APT) family kinase protein
VPEVIAIEDDPSVLGRPFFLMDRVTGNVPGGRPSIHRDPWLMSLTAAQRRMAMTNGLDALAEVHATPWHALPGMTEKSRTRAEELAELQRWYDWARRDQHFQLIEAAIAALGGARPDISEDVLLWGDPRPGNIIFAGDLSVAAVIDWEIAGLGPREADVGWWLMMDEFASRGVDGAVLDGMPTAAESVAYYCAASGSALGALEYFALLASVRLAITLLPAADSLITRGIIPAASRFAHDNVPTQMIARHLGKSEPELSDDYRRLSRMGRATGSGVSSGTGG